MSKVYRWKCPHCGTEGFGSMKPHDKPHGVACRKSGQVSERETMFRVSEQLRTDDEAAP